MIYINVLVKETVNKSRELKIILDGYSIYICTYVVVGFLHNVFTFSYFFTASQINDIWYVMYERYRKLIFLKFNLVLIINHKYTVMYTCIKF